MTNSPQTDPLRIPLAHSVRYVARGLPEVPNQYGRGVLAPSEITLTYRTSPDSQLGRVHAYVAGRLWVDGVEVPLLSDGLYGQHYSGDPSGWPEWLAAEARLHDPEAASVPSAPTQTADADRRDRWRHAARDIARRDWADEVRCAPLDDGEFEQDATDLMAVADTEQATIRDAVLREAIGELEALRDKTDVQVAEYPRYDAQQKSALNDAIARLRRMADCHECETGAEHTVHCPTPETHNWGCGCPSDVAAAIASCPGREMVPSPCRCPCYGCKHHCGAHDPAAVPAAVEEQPRCDVEFEGGGHCAKPAGHRPPGSQDPHVPAVEEQPDTGTPFVTRVLELFSMSHADAYGDLFWRVDDGEIRLYANVSDVFAWGGSDAEEITPVTLPALEQAYADLKAIEAEEFTAELYTARVRGERPQGAAYPSDTHEAWRQVSALYDACGPERELGLGNPKAAPAHKERS